MGGPLLGLICWGILKGFRPTGLESSAMRCAGTTVWMAVWWVTEAVPLGVTSLLPVVVFPLFGIMSSEDVSPNYTGRLIWLFFGGVQLACSAILGTVIISSPFSHFAPI